jgi:phosphate uptake regulator
MDVRRLVSFGNSSFVISLPKAWVTKNGLKKGDMLRIEERPYELIITSRDEGKKKISESIINCEGKGLPELKTEIIAAYVNNSNLIKLNNTKTLGSQLKQIIHGLVGMEVIEETSSTIVVKDLLDVSEVSIDNIVRRMDILLKSMLEDSLGNDKFDNLSERDMEVNRLALLAVRIFRAATHNPGMLKIFNTNYWDMFISRQISVQLELIGDHIKRTSRLLKSAKNDEEARKIFAQLAARYREAMKVYYAKDKQNAYKLEADTRKFTAACEKIMEKTKDFNALLAAEQLKGMTKAIMYILRNTMENSEPQQQ